MTALRPPELRLFGRCARFMRCGLVAAAMALFLAAPTRAAADPTSPSATPVAGAPAGKDQQREAVVTYLRHVYSVYFGMRSCTEMGAQQQDRSFLPLISLDEARRRLRLIDAAVAEVGLDADRVWRQSAPLAEVTAEALKRDPVRHLPHCQRMTSLFRMDADNLQVVLQALGAKTSLVPKDY